MSLFLVSVTTGQLLCPVDHAPLTVDRTLEHAAAAYGMFKLRAVCPAGHSHHWPPVAPVAEPAQAPRAQPMGHRPHVWVAPSTRRCQDCRKPFRPTQPAERRCAACRALPPCWSCRGRLRHHSWCRSRTAGGRPHDSTLGLARAAIRRRGVA